MTEHFNGDALASSKYFKRFNKLDKMKNEYTEAYFRPMILKGDMILVERLPSVEMKTNGGIIIPDVKTHKDTAHDAQAEFGIVLMVGPGQVFEDGTTLPCDSKPGDVVLLPGNTAWYSQFGHMSDYGPYTIGRLRDSQVSLWFNDYKKAMDILNEPEFVQTDWNSSDFPF